MTMFKPKKCQKCGHNDFCITETVKYNAHLDAKTKRLITDCVLVSNIDKVYCLNCGQVQDRADFEISELQE
jgi:hypothetical protein